MCRPTSCAGTAANQPTSCVPVVPTRSIRQTARGGYAWEEMLASWVALRALALQAAAEAAEGAEQTAVAQEGAAAAAEGAAAAAADDATERPAADGRDGEGAAGALPVGADAPGQAVPPLDVWLLDLFEREDDSEAQLDYVARFRPAAVAVEEWDRRVSKVRHSVGKA